MRKRPGPRLLPFPGCGPSSRGTSRSDALSEAQSGTIMACESHNHATENCLSTKCSNNPKALPIDPGRGSPFFPPRLLDSLR